MPVCCVAGTMLDFGLAGVGVIFLFCQWLGCTKTHALFSSAVLVWVGFSFFVLCCSQLNLDFN